MHSETLFKKAAQVYAWGCGRSGQLGHGDEKDVHNPKLIRALQSKLIRQARPGTTSLGATY